MTLLAALFQILKNLPELLDLIKHLEKQAKEAETERKVKEDLKTINQAFKEKDADALRTLFNS